MNEKPSENEIIINEIRYKDGFSNDKVYDPKEYIIVKREDIDKEKKELIAEFVEDLNDVEIPLGEHPTICYYHIIKLIRKWEARSK